MSLFEGKTVMITGGTGSFGRAVLDRFLCTDIGQIRVLSRDEKKQDDMRHAYQAAMPEAADKLHFVLGDVRDAACVRSAMRGVDYVFHAAALKQVPSCEFYPLEAVKTNVLGTENVLSAAVEEGVSGVVCLSTDKAVYPVNAMGMSKALMEKVALAKSRTLRGGTRILCARYGNVLCTRGSVIPLWIEQLKRGQPLTLTAPDMTRFIMTLEEAVALVLYALQHGENGDLLVQKASACTVGTLARAVCSLFGNGSSRTEVIGVRHGEKLSETLLTAAEMAAAVDMGNYFRVPCDRRDLNYELCRDMGTTQAAMDYHSGGVPLLDERALQDKLLSLPYIRRALDGMGRGAR